MKVNWNDPKYAQELMQKGQESYRAKDGDVFKGILDDQKVKDLGVNILKISPGTHCWDVLPYLCGENDPDVVMAGKPVGTATFTVGVHVHKNVGPENSTFICLARTYGKRCPLCELKNELSRDPNTSDEDIKRLLTGKYRTFLYNIWDRDHESKGVQIVQVSGFFFERHVQAQAMNKRTGGYTPFFLPGAGPQGGRHVTFEMKGSGKNQEWYGHKLEVREQAIPQKILEQAICLDNLLYVPTYDEVYDAYYAGMEDAGEPESAGAEVIPPDCFQGDEEYEECASCVFAADCHVDAEAEAGTDNPPWGESDEDAVNPEPEPEEIPDPMPKRTPTRRTQTQPPPSPHQQKPSSSTAPVGKRPLRRGQK